MKLISLHRRLYDPGFLADTLLGPRFHLDGDFSCHGPLGLLMVDKGYQVQDAAFVVSVYTPVAMVFQLVGGYGGGKIPIRLALAFFTALQAMGVGVFGFYADSLPSIYAFAVFFGGGFGGRNPLTVAIRGEYFGSASFGKILGFSTVPMNLLLLIAAPLVGGCVTYRVIIQRLSSYGVD
ncbi:MAG: hypothetical protein Ct9H300mP11_32120 [Chloroflexota bacterium]|nr:MAG: hypothetical protein Ct9H300mP11_32120 [Chloroflexota bacterium]